MRLPSVPSAPVFRRKPFERGTCLWSWRERERESDIALCSEKLWNRIEQRFGKPESVKRQEA